MEGELEQKQNFLRINILEKGCDAEQFMAFLQSKKGELGLDLNNWTLNELTLAVQEFNLLNNNNNINQQNNNQNYYSEQQIPQPNNNNINQVDMGYQLPPTEEYIHCEKIVPNELAKSNDVNIKLSFPEKVEGGLFTKSYVTYLMETYPFGYKIRKRYSDFEWLRNILSTIYVNCVIPPLCKKNFTGRFSEILISKRTRSIEKFMNGILIHPIMKNSDIFYNFISMANEADFEKKKKEYNRLTSPVVLNQVKTFDGELNVTVSKEKEIYFENIKDYADLNEEILKKITTEYKALITLMDQISDRMKEISELWKDLYRKNMNYFEKENTTTSYNIMSKIMLDWREINKKQRILINEGIREYFRYVKNEFNSLRELSSKVENNKTIYMKAFDKLMALKESAFKQDISTWGLNPEDLEHKTELLTNKNLAFTKMLPFDTKKVDELKQNYGFYLNSIISEFERIRELNSERHKNNIQKFVKDIKDSLNEIQVYLTDRISYYDEINEENNGSNNNQDTDLKQRNNN
jgi:sorting nexin-7/30/sorting nexin-8